MKKQKKLYGLLLSLLLACSLLFSGSMASVEAAGQGDMAVHFIDVGQGLAILVQSAGENLLYDGGDRSHANEVVEYLKNQQVDTIDYMISSHYDEDHLGGLVKCLDNFEVEHILGSDYVHTSELFNTFMNTATANWSFCGICRLSETLMNSEREVSQSWRLPESQKTVMITLW